MVRSCPVHFQPGLKGSCFVPVHHLVTAACSLKFGVSGVIVMGLSGLCFFFCFGGPGAWTDWARME